MSSAASSSIRRLPFREAVSSLRQGSEKVTLSSDVAGVMLRFVAKNSEAGPRQFLRNHAPRLAYANPTLPFTIERIRDPRTKSKDPNNPDKDAVWKDGMPKPEMVVSFHGAAPAQTLPLTHLDGDKILAQLISVAGEARMRGIEAPPITSGSGPASAATTSTAA
ncbi:hypothetical protein IAU59_007003 [Kwoniella sp. CBS 9459]